MPISPSPLVQGYMQQGQQPQGAPMTADQMFEKNFSDMAFNQMRSKYPQLMNYVVTFKVLDSNVEDGRAFGAFVLQDGKGLLYLPVVMGNGAVTSCEMLYNKEEDSFAPLSADSVRNVQRDNMLLGGEMLMGNAHVDDTKDIFKNMIRPPASSNVVMAGEHGVSALPNAAKEAVSAWLNGNPDALAKIAMTYDVAELATKLAQAKEEPSIAPMNMFLTVKQASQVSCLNEQDRKTLLEDGFLVKKAEDSGTAVTSAHDIDRMADQELHLEEYVPQAKKLSEDRSIRKGNAVVYDGGDFKLVPCLLFGGDILFEDGKRLYSSYSAMASTLIQGMSDEVTEEDLKAVGAKPIKQVAREGVNDYSTMFIAVPTRSGGWKAFVTFMGSVEPSIVGDEVYIGGIHATSAIRYGFIKEEHGSTDRILIPSNSLVIKALDNSKGWDDGAPKGLVRNFDEFRRLVLSKGRQLTTRKDGPSVNIVDHGDGSSNTFHSKTAAAKWLFDKFAMSQDQVKTVLDNYASVIFEKRAFMPAPQVDPNTGMEMPMDAPQPGMMPQQPTQPNGAPAQPQFDPNMVQAGIDVGGQDAIDTGILASFAQDPDIKALLVDYMPYFLQMLDKLGRVILLMSLEKKDMEAQYGMERYADLLASCRKMFKMLGDIVNQLKKYVNMA